MADNIKQLLVFRVTCVGAISISYKTLIRNVMFSEKYRKLLSSYSARIWTRSHYTTSKLWQPFSGLYGV